MTDKEIKEYRILKAFKKLDATDREFLDIQFRKGVKEKEALIQLLTEYRAQGYCSEDIEIGELMNYAEVIGLDTSFMNREEIKERNDATFDEWNRLIVSTALTSLIEKLESSEGGTFITSNETHIFIALLKQEIALLKRELDAL